MTKFENSFTVMENSYHYTNDTNNATDIGDNIFEEDDDIRRLRQIFNRILWWYILVAASGGIALNINCVSVLIKIRERHTYFTLLTIAAADLFALVLILFPHLGVLLVTRRELFTPVFCKIHTFFLHTFSAYSIWCWVLLSIVRYLAVFYPYKHMKIQLCRIKYKLFVTFIVCMLLEIWVPVVVTSESGYCSLDMGLVSLEGWQKTNLFDVISTYVLPFTCMSATNAVVFGRIYMCSQKYISKHRTDNLAVRQRNSRGMGRNGSVMSKSRAKRLRQERFNSLKRLIIIVVVSLSLNLPNCVVRLLNTFNPNGTWMIEPYNEVIQKISYALSYTHYAINCIYLKLVVKGRSAKRRRPSQKYSEDTVSKCQSVEVGGSPNKYSNNKSVPVTTVRRYNVASD